MSEKKPTPPPSPPLTEEDFSIRTPPYRGPKPPPTPPPTKKK